MPRGMRAAVRSRSLIGGGGSRGGSRLARRGVGLAPPVHGATFAPGRSRVATWARHLGRVPLVEAVGNAGDCHHSGISLTAATAPPELNTRRSGRTAHYSYTFSQLPMPFEETRVR